MDKNPKFEYRNPEQSLISNDQIFKTVTFGLYGIFSVLNFKLWSFEIVSSFGFRAWDLEIIG